MIYVVICGVENNAKRNEISKWRNLAKNIVLYSSDVENYAEKIVNSGIKPLDALHLACSIYSECDYFITVDDKLLKCNDDRIQIVNPFEFVTLYGG